MISGVSIQQWQNYNNFISILQVIIKDNINRIKKNQQIIDESVKRWSKNQIQFKIWQHFNIINKKKIFNIKKIQEEIINSNQMQLKFFKKGK